MNPLTPTVTDRTDIIERILEAAQGEAGLTERKIMYAFSLPHIEVDLYVSSMIRNELLSYDVKTNSYRTTEKGHDFLESIRKMYELDDLTD
ncbi:MAG: putative transcriptional regulator [Candidatus Nitrosomirales archaeon]|jgi:predicted transcriptional regulator